MERSSARLLLFRHADMAQLAVYAAWGSVVGSGLQVALQLPVVLRLAPGLRLVFIRCQENVRTVISNFVPVFISRGVNQVSGYVDQILASYLPRGGFRLSSGAGALYAAGEPVWHVDLGGRTASDVERAGHR